MKRRLEIGCTVERHRRIGIDAVVNARGGRQDLNNQTSEDVELMRDAVAIRNRVHHRVRVYQFNSKFLRRHRSRVEHLLARRDEI